MSRYGDWTMPVLPEGEPWMRAIDPITGDAVEAEDVIEAGETPTVAVVDGWETRVDEGIDPGATVVVTTTRGEPTP